MPHRISSVESIHHATSIPSALQKHQEETGNTQTGTEGKEPKTSASERIVHIAPDVVEVLRAQRARQAADPAAIGVAADRGGVVFASLTGGILDPHNLSRTFRSLVKQAGVTPVGLYALRHTHASLLIKHDFDPMVVSERLGHTNVAFTQTIYQHLYDERRSQAAIGLAQMLS